MVTDIFSLWKVPDNADIIIVAALYAHTVTWLHQPYRAEANGGFYLRSGNTE